MLYIDDHIWDFNLDEALQSVSPQRREQALQFKFELGRRQSVLAYLLLKRGLYREFGITENPMFEYGEHGKPAIVGRPDIFFNLSPCREAVACVIDTVPVGIDVESVRSIDDSLARYTMNDDELRVIAEAERKEEAFIRFWTMKEARLKLSGRGLLDDMKTVLADDSAVFETLRDKAGRYYCTTCRWAKRDD